MTEALERLIALFQAEGQQGYIGEPVSQWAHASKAGEGDHRERYFLRKRAEFPPEQERVPGIKYADGVFNVGNPIL